MNLLATVQQALHKAHLAVPSLSKKLGSAGTQANPPSDQAASEPPMEPVDRMIRSAAATLIRLCTDQREKVLRAEDVESIRECEQSAGWMGLSSSEFRRRVVEHVIEQHGAPSRMEAPQVGDMLRRIMGAP
jgi:hypothetical protein